MKPTRFALVALALSTLALAQNAATGANDALMNRHSSSSAQINSGNAAQLRLAWRIPTQDPVSHSPIVDGGKVYFADWGGNADAADAATGRLLWKNKLEQPIMDWDWHGFAGEGVLGDGTLFEASAEGYAFALDPATGSVKWKTDFAPESQYAGNIARLLYADGLLYVGVSSIEEHAVNNAYRQGKPFTPRFRGRVIALNARTGQQVWRRDLVQAPGNGVSVWSSLALDARRNTLFFTTGNNYSGAPTEMSDSMVAVDARTGAVKWSRQTFENDVWLPVKPLGPDYDFSGGPQLFEARVNGELRSLVGAGQKSGLFWAFDRETGEPVWRTVVSYGGVDGGMQSEAAIGGSRVYAWGNNGYSSEDVSVGESSANVIALDAATGQIAWRQTKVQPAALGAAPFLSRDVLFTGAQDGKLRAYRATDGMKLWASPAMGPVGASPKVVGNALFVGVGIPDVKGALATAKGVYAYTVGGARPDTGR